MNVSSNVRNVSANHVRFAGREEYPVLRFDLLGFDTEQRADFMLCELPDWALFRRRSLLNAKAAGLPNVFITQIFVTGTSLGTVVASIAGLGACHPPEPGESKL